MSRVPKRGRPPKEGDVESFYLTVPKPLHDYLRFLARNTYAGADIGEVASHLLKLKVAELGAKLDVPKKTPSN
jgi:hypothetical protein